MRSRLPRSCTRRDGAREPASYARSALSQSKSPHALDRSGKERRDETNVSSQTPGSALSKDQIRELVAPMEQRTRRYARRLAFLFLLSGALIAALVTLLAILADNAVTTENIAPGGIVFLFFGGLAGVCARALVLSDLRWLPELIGKGRTLAGTIMSHRVVAKGIHKIVVVCQEGDDEVGA